MGGSYFKTRNFDEKFKQNETQEFPMHRVNVEEGSPAEVVRGKRAKFRTAKSPDMMRKASSRSGNQEEPGEPPKKGSMLESMRKALKQKFNQERDKILVQQEKEQLEQTQEE